MKQKILKLCLLVLTFAIILSACVFSMSSASAEICTGNCGENLTWSFDTGTEVLKISGSGDNLYYDTFDGLPWDPYQPKTVELPEGLTSICEYAFYRCTNLEKITNLDGVENIHQMAFEGCEKLTEITIPDSVTYLGNSVFSNCRSLKKVILPSNLTRIRTGTFYGCKRLTDIIIPESVTEIGDNAFVNCYDLEKIIIPQSVTHVGINAFNSCDNLTIYGYSGTEAEFTAEEYNVPFIALDACEHEYDNGCDTKCNKCGNIRKAEGHIHTSACDKDCNVCGLVREVGEHIYGSKYDINCNECGAVREVVVDANAPIVSLDRIICKTGNTVTVAVSLDKNPGIWGMDLELIYDKTQLTLTSVTNGTVFSEEEYIPGKIDGDIYILYYEAAEFENVTNNGVLATLEFTVNENADIDTFSCISLTYDAGDIINMDYKDVDVGIVSGGIDIVDYIYGDLNSDGLINKKDFLALQLYLSGNDVPFKIDLEAANVFADGTINKKDVLLLKQYLAGRDVTLGV